MSKMGTSIRKGRKYGFIALLSLALAISLAISGVTAAQAAPARRFYISVAGQKDTKQDGTMSFSREDTANLRTAGVFVADPNGQRVTGSYWWGGKLYYSYQSCFESVKAIEIYSPDISATSSVKMSLDVTNTEKTRNWPVVYEGTTYTRYVYKSTTAMTTGTFNDVMGKINVFMNPDSTRRSASAKIIVRAWTNADAIPTDYKDDKAPGFKAPNELIGTSFNDENYVYRTLYSRSCEIKFYSYAEGKLEDDTIRMDYKADAAANYDELYEDYTDAGEAVDPADAEGGQVTFDVKLTDTGDGAYRARVGYQCREAGRAWDNDTVVGWNDSIFGFGTPDSEGNYSAYYNVMELDKYNKSQPVKGLINLQTWNKNIAIPLKVTGLKAGVTYEIRGFIETDGRSDYTYTDIFTVKYDKPVINTVNSGSVGKVYCGGATLNVSIGIDFNDKNKIFTDDNKVETPIEAVDYDGESRLGPYLSAKLYFTPHLDQTVVRDPVSGEEKPGTDSSVWYQVNDFGIISLYDSEKGKLSNAYKTNCSHILPEYMTQLDPTYPDATATIDSTRCAYKLVVTDMYTGYSVYEYSDVFTIDSTPPTDPTILVESDGVRLSVDPTYITEMFPVLDEDGAPIIEDGHPIFKGNPAYNGKIIPKTDSEGYVVFEGNTIVEIENPNYDARTDTSQGAVVGGKVDGKAAEVTIKIGDSYDHGGSDVKEYLYSKYFIATDKVPSELKSRVEVLQYLLDDSNYDPNDRRCPIEYTDWTPAGDVYEEVDGKPVKTNWSTLNVANDGYYRIDVKATDNAGYQTGIQQAVFRVDLTAPNTPEVYLVQYNGTAAVTEANVAEQLGPYDERTYTNKTVWLIAYSEPQTGKELKYFEYSDDGGMTWRTVFDDTQRDAYGNFITVRGEPSDVKAENRLVNLSNGSDMPTDKLVKVYAQDADGKTEYNLATAEGKKWQVAINVSADGGDDGAGHDDYNTFMVRAVDTLGNESLISDAVVMRTIGRTPVATGTIEHEGIEVALAIGNTNMPTSGLTPDLKNNAAYKINQRYYGTDGSANINLLNDPATAEQFNPWLYVLDTNNKHTKTGDWTCTWEDDDACKGPCHDDTCPYKTLAAKGYYLYTPEQVNVQGLSGANANDTSRFNWVRYDHSMVYDSAITYTLFTGAKSTYSICEPKPTDMAANTSDQYKGYTWTTGTGTSAVTHTLYTATRDRIILMGQTAPSSTSSLNDNQQYTNYLDEYVKVTHYSSGGNAWSGGADTRTGTATFTWNTVMLQRVYHLMDISYPETVSGSNRTYNVDAGTDAPLSKLANAGYTQGSYREWLFLYNNQPAKKTIFFTIDDGRACAHTNDGYGFLFNTTIRQSYDGPAISYKDKSGVTHSYNPKDGVPADNLVGGSDGSWRISGYLFYIGNASISNRDDMQGYKWYILQLDDINMEHFSDSCLRGGAYRGNGGYGYTSTGGSTGKYKKSGTMGDKDTSDGQLGYYDDLIKHVVGNASEKQTYNFGVTMMKSMSPTVTSTGSGTGGTRYINNFVIQTEGTETRIYNFCSGKSGDSYKTVTKDEDIKENVAGSYYTLDQLKKKFNANVNKANPNGKLSGTASAGTQGFTLLRWGSSDLTKNKKGEYVAGVVNTPRPKVDGIEIGGDVARATGVHRDTNCYGFGPLYAARSYSHWCYQDTRIEISNISMQLAIAKSLSEVVTEPQWGNGKAKFIANITDDATDDFQDPILSAQIQWRLFNDNAKFIGWGNYENGATTLEFIDRIDGDGTYEYTENADESEVEYDIQIDDVATYITQQYYGAFGYDLEFLRDKNGEGDLVRGADGKLILVDGGADIDYDASGKPKIVGGKVQYTDPNHKDTMASMVSEQVNGHGAVYSLADASNIQFTVTPAKYNSSTANPDFPAGRWYVVHDGTGYSNTTDKKRVGTFTDGLDIKISEPGRYVIYFAPDMNKVNTQTLDPEDATFDFVVNSPPVSRFSGYIEDDGTVRIDNAAYDPDTGLRKTGDPYPTPTVPKQTSPAKAGAKAAADEEPAYTYEITLNGTKVTKEYNEGMDPVQINGIVKEEWRWEILASYLDANEESHLFVAAQSDGWVTTSPDGTPLATLTRGKVTTEGVNRSSTYDEGCLEHDTVSIHNGDGGTVNKDIYYFSKVPTGAVLTVYQRMTDTSAVRKAIIDDDGMVTGYYYESAGETTSGATQQNLTGSNSVTYAPLSSFSLSSVNIFDTADENGSTGRVTVTRKSKHTQKRHDYVLRWSIDLGDGYGYRYLVRDKATGNFYLYPFEGTDDYYPKADSATGESAEQKQESNELLPESVENTSEMPENSWLVMRADPDDPEGINDDGDASGTWHIEKSFFEDFVELDKSIVLRITEKVEGRATSTAEVDSWIVDSSARAIYYKADTVAPTGQVVEAIVQSKVQMVDENGMPMYDEETGKPIYDYEKVPHMVQDSKEVQYTVTNTVNLPVYVAAMVDGQPTVVRLLSGGEQVEIPAEEEGEEGTPVYVLATDENGQPLQDTNGDNVYLPLTDAGILFTEEMDEGATVTVVVHKANGDTLEGAAAGQALTTEVHVETSAEGTTQRQYTTQVEEIKTRTEKLWEDEEKTIPKMVQAVDPETKAPLYDPIFEEDGVTPKYLWEESDYEASNYLDVSGGARRIVITTSGAKDGQGAVAGYGFYFYKKSANATAGNDGTYETAIYYISDGELVEVPITSLDESVTYHPDVDELNANSAWRALTPEQRAECILRARQKAIDGMKDGGYLPGPDGGDIIIDDSLMNLAMAAETSSHSTTLNVAIFAYDNADRGTATASGANEGQKTRMENIKVTQSRPMPPEILVTNATNQVVARIGNGAAFTDESLKSESEKGVTEDVQTSELNSAANTNVTVQFNPRQNTFTKNSDGIFELDPSSKAKFYQDIYGEADQSGVANVMFTIEYRESETDQWKYYKNVETYHNYVMASAKSVTLTETAHYRITAEIVNGAGTVSEKRQVQFVIDKVVPTVITAHIKTKDPVENRFIDYVQGEWAQSVTLSMEGSSDNNAGAMYKYSIDNGKTWMDYGGLSEAMKEISITTTGEHNLRIKVVDRAGNEQPLVIENPQKDESEEELNARASSSAILLKIDGEAPIVPGPTLTASSVSTPIYTNYIISVNTDKELGTVTSTVDGGTPNSNDTEIPVPFGGSVRFDFTPEEDCVLESVKYNGVLQALQGSEESGWYLELEDVMADASLNVEFKSLVEPETNSLAKTMYNQTKTVSALRNVQSMGAKVFAAAPGSEASTYRNDGIIGGVNVLDEPTTTYRVTVTCSPVGGSVSEGQVVPSGSSYTVTILPATGYYTKEVWLNGTPVDNDFGDKRYDYVLENITQDTSIVVFFAEKATRNVQITTSDCGRAVLNESEGGITQNHVKGGYDIALGVEMVLSLMPEDGYGVKEVTVDGVSADLETDGVTFKMTVPAYTGEGTDPGIKVHVTFDIAKDNPYVIYRVVRRGINVLDDGDTDYHGTVALGQEEVSDGQAVSIPMNGARNFIITPDKGYKIDSVLVQQGSSSPIPYTTTKVPNSRSEILTVRNPMNSGTIIVTFKTNVFVGTVDNRAGGIVAIQQVTEDGKYVNMDLGSIPEGTKVIVRAIPNPGYQVTNLYVTEHQVETPRGAVRSYVIDSISSHIRAHAQFERRIIDHTDYKHSIVAVASGVKDPQDNLVKVSENTGSGEEVEVSLPYRFRVSDGTNISDWSDTWKEEDENGQLKERGWQSSNSITITDMIVGGKVVGDGLKPNAWYTVQVQARDTVENYSTVNNDLSNSSSQVCTLAQMPYIYEDGVTVRNTVGDPSSKSIAMLINPNGNPADTEYLAYYSTSPTMTPRYTANYVVDPDTGEVLKDGWGQLVNGEIVIDGLTPGIKYYLQVVARNKQGKVTELNNDNIVSKMLSPGAPPLASMYFEEQATPNGGIRLGWAEPEGAVLQIKIYRDGTILDTVNASDERTYLDTEISSSGDHIGVYSYAYVNSAGTGSTQTAVSKEYYDLYQKVHEKDDEEEDDTPATPGTGTGEEPEPSAEQLALDELDAVKTTAKYDVYSEFMTYPKFPLTQITKVTAPTKEGTTTGDITVVVPRDGSMDRYQKYDLVLRAYCSVSDLSKMNDAALSRWFTGASSVSGFADLEGEEFAAAWNTWLTANASKLNTAKATWIRDDFGDYKYIELKDDQWVPSTAYWDETNNKQIHVTTTAPRAAEASATWERLPTDYEYRVFVREIRSTGKRTAVDGYSQGQSSAGVEYTLGKVCFVNKTEFGYKYNIENAEVKKILKDKTSTWSNEELSTYTGGKGWDQPISDYIEFNKSPDIRLAGDNDLYDGNGDKICEANGKKYLLIDDSTGDSKFVINVAAWDPDGSYDDEVSITATLKIDKNATLTGKAIANEGTGKLKPMKQRQDLAMVKENLYQIEFDASTLSTGIYTDVTLNVSDGSTSESHECKDGDATYPGITLIVNHTQPSVRDESGSHKIEIGKTYSTDRLVTTAFVDRARTDREMAKIRLRVMPDQFNSSDMFGAGAANDLDSLITRLTTAAGSNTVAANAQTHAKALLTNAEKTNTDYLKNDMLTEEGALLAIARVAPKIDAYLRITKEQYDELTDLAEELQTKEGATAEEIAKGKLLEKSLRMDNPDSPYYWIEWNYALDNLDYVFTTEGLEDTKICSWLEKEDATHVTSVGKPGEYYAELVATFGGNESHQTVTVQAKNVPTITFLGDPALGWVTTKVKEEYNVYSGVGDYSRITMGDVIRDAQSCFPTIEVPAFEDGENEDTTAARKITVDGTEIMQVYKMTMSKGVVTNNWLQGSMKIDFGVYNRFETLGVYVTADPNFDPHVAIPDGTTQVPAPHDVDTKTGNEKTYYDRAGEYTFSTGNLKNNTHYFLWAYYTAIDPVTGELHTGYSEGRTVLTTTASYKLTYYGFTTPFYELHEEDYTSTRGDQFFNVVGSGSTETEAILRFTLDYYKANEFGELLDSKGDVITDETKQEKVPLTGNQLKWAEDTFHFQDGGTTMDVPVSKRGFGTAALLLTDTLDKQGHMIARLTVSVLQDITPYTVVLPGQDYTDIFVQDNESEIQSFRINVRNTDDEGKKIMGESTDSEGKLIYNYTLNGLPFPYYSNTETLTISYRNGGTGDLKNIKAAVYDDLSDMETGKESTKFRIVREPTETYLPSSLDDLVGYVGVSCMPNLGDDVHDGWLVLTADHMKSKDYIRVKLTQIVGQSTLHGRIYITSGGEPDPGQWAGKSTVCLYDGNATTSSLNEQNLLYSTETDELGNYTIPNVINGKKYHVVVKRDGFITYSSVDPGMMEGVPLTTSAESLHYTFTIRLLGGDANNDGRVDRATDLEKWLIPRFNTFYNRLVEPTDPEEKEEWLILKRLDYNQDGVVNALDRAFLYNNIGSTRYSYYQYGGYTVISADPKTP